MAQDLDAHSPHQNDPVSKQQHAAEKKKGGRIVDQEKVEQKFQKHNIDMQDKEVRKRIKKNKKKADKWNKRNRWLREYRNDLENKKHFFFWTVS